MYDQNGKDINTLNLEIEQGLPIDVGETGYTNKNRFDCQGSAFFENPAP